MKRRHFLKQAMATGLLAAVPAVTTAATPQYLNGRWNPSRELFFWDNINVDPYGNQSLQQALNLLGVPAQNQPVVIQAIEVRPGVYTRPNQGVQRIQRGHQYAAMVSGGVRTSKAWAVPNVVPRPHAGWQSTLVDVWVIWVGNTRYIIGRPHACNNWIIMYGTTAPYYCPKPCC